MIVLRCKHCQARIQVPSPGIYRCHNCGKPVEITLEEVQKSHIPVDSYAKTVQYDKNLNIPSHIPKHQNIDDDKSINAFCRNHSQRKAIKACRSCGDLLCEDCAIKLDTFIYCRKCLLKIQKESTTVQKPKLEIAFEKGESSIPLEQRSITNYFSKFFLTIKEAILNNRKFFTNTTKNRHLVKAIIFAVIMNFIYDLTRFLAFNYFGVVSKGFPQDVEGLIAKIYAVYMNASIETLAISPAVILILVLILTLIYQFGIFLFRCKGDLLGTFKIVCYATASQAFSIILVPIPFFGAPVTFIFFIIIMIQGFIHLHKFQDEKAILISLFPIMIIILTIIVGVFFTF
jgi:hypothetical protein